MGLFSKKKSGKGGGKGAAASPDLPGSDRDDDISLMSEDWEEERAALQAALSGTPAKAEDFENSSLWAEVDRDELERIALNIARNAVPPAAAAGSEENAEAAARLSISAAVAEQAEAYDSTDPLGYGRIDTRSLKLSRDLGPGGASYKPRYTSRGSVFDPSGRRPGAGTGRGGDDAGGSGEAPPALRAKVLPGGEQFDAGLYLGTIHADTTLPQLLQGLAALRQQLSEHTGQLKSLVKENFDRFTSSKNTIDTVYAKLQRAEVEGEAGVHGSSTAEVLDAVRRVQDEARKAFGPLLERHAKADRIRLVLGVMQRYEAVVQLPSRVRQHADAGDYDQVVSDYKKAKALLGQQGGSSGGGGTGSAAGASPAGPLQQQGEGSMWGKLMVEIDKVVGSVAHSLETAVRSVQSSPGEAFDAIRWILQLRAVGVPAAQSMDPVGLYVSSQERHVRALLEAALTQHKATLEALKRAQRESEEEEAQAAALASLGIAAPSPAKYPTASAAAAAAGSPAASGLSPSAGASPRRGSSTGSEALAAASEAEGVRYVALITQGLCQWLPEFWALTQQRLRGLAEAVEGEGGCGEAAAAVARGTAAAQRSVAILLELYRSAVLNLLASPATAGLTHAGLLSVAAELASGFALLQAGPASAGGGGGSGAAAAAGEAHPGALDCLQLLAERTLQASLEQLARHLHAAVAQACRAEDFRLTAASRRAGQPATASVAALQALVQQGMQHLQAALAEADRAGVSLQAKAAASARDAFFGCFSAFAAGVGSLADSLLNGGHQQQQAGHAPSLAAEAAAAAAVASAAAEGGSGGREAVPASPARRLLVLCANLGAARSRLLPRQYVCWAALLQAGGSSGKELQAAAQTCAAELEAVETRLAGAYIDRKQVMLDEVMEQLLFTGGTVWEAAPPPQGVRPIVLECVHALVATQAELAAMAPALLLEALEELVLGTFEGLTQVLAQGSPAASPGGALQLCLEASFLLAAAAGLGGDPLQQAAGRLRAAVDQRLQAAVAAAARGPEAAQLAAWSVDGAASTQAAAGAAAAGRASAAACRLRLEQLCREAQAAARRNLAPLQQLAAPRR
ncbi:hypothetical protein ABPG75_008280 [Micractinium tetrahymenae]